MSSSDKEVILLQKQWLPEVTMKCSHPTTQERKSATESAHILHIERGYRHSPISIASWHFLILFSQYHPAD